MKSIVFFGSSPFSTIVLEKLLSSKRYELKAVVTKPDQPVGRGQKLTANPVKLIAEKHGISVITDIKDFLQTDIPQGTIGLVAAYGKILGPKTLSKFNNQIFGIHPSLLPKYRGPSPLQQQILDDAPEVGVTILQIDLGEDTGPIVAQISDHLQPDDTQLTLGNRLFDKGVELFLSLTDFTTTPQENSLATDTRMFTREDGFEPWDKFCHELSTNNYELEKKHRAFFPWPGVWTTMPNGKRLKLIAYKPVILVQIEGKSPQTWYTISCDKRGS